jgi:hypothetical protein
VPRAVEHPIEATLQVTEKVLVNNRTMTEMNNPLESQDFWLLSPLLVALLILVLLFVFGHAHLSLHARLGLEDKLKRLRSPVPRAYASHRLTRAWAGHRADLDDRIEPERRLSNLYGDNSQTCRLDIDESTRSEFGDSSDGQATY